MSFFEYAGAAILLAVDGAGKTMLLLGRALGWSRRSWYYRREVLAQMLFCGVESLPVVSVVALFAGMIVALQTGTELAAFGLQDSIGSIVAASVCREMGPVFAAIIVAARVGSAMAAQLGTMKVGEEIDALEAMSISPIRYLVMPRVVGLVLMMPVLTMFADVIGILGGALVGRLQVNVPYAVFFDRVQNNLQIKDIFIGVFKATVFGLTIAAVACRQGLSATSGALGVGRATTSTVVIALMYVLIFNYFITALFY